MTTTTTVNVPVEFIKLARELRAAQKAGVQSQKEWRRAQSLGQQFDAKLATIVKVMSMVEKPAAEQGAFHVDQ
jgi:hypothetical protein